AGDRTPGPGPERGQRLRDTQRPSARRARLARPAAPSRGRVPHGAGDVLPARRAPAASWLELQRDLDGEARSISVPPTIPCPTPISTMSAAGQFRRGFQTVGQAFQPDLSGPNVRLESLTYD